MGKGEGLTECMGGPRISLLQSQSLSSNFLCSVFVVGLLQTEGKTVQEEWLCSIYNIRLYSAHNQEGRGREEDRGRREGGKREEGKGEREEEEEGKG